MKTISATTSTKAWLAGTDYLRSTSQRVDYALILEVAQPMSLPPEDKIIYDKVNSFLDGRGGKPINTVINTIFPAGLYVREGAVGVHETFGKLWPKIKKHPDVKWGTYARRMTHRTKPDNTSIDPLALLIEKLKNQLKTNHPIHATYELSTYDPILDIPIYDDCLDGRKPLGYPCLSHLSFKLTEERRLMLVALYRSHYYVQRALGNLYGLGWLQHYVATQAAIEPASLLCISTMAKLETETGKWGRAAVDTLLDDCNRPAMLPAII